MVLNDGNPEGLFRAAFMVHIRSFEFAYHNLMSTHIGVRLPFRTQGRRLRPGYLRRSSRSNELLRRVRHSAVSAKCSFPDARRRHDDNAFDRVLPESQLGLRSADRWYVHQTRSSDFAARGPLREGV